MRRCDSDACMIKAERTSKVVSLNLPVATILHNPQREWTRMATGNRRMASTRNVNVDWDKFNIEEHLLTHVSIVCSVATTENGYYIEPPCDELVNANGNAWTTPVLLSTFKTFIGAQNYFEHVQIPALSKGCILDAILRPVTYVGKDGNSKAEILWCDILVATDRMHSDLVGKIESGQLSTLSMGCGIQGTRIQMGDLSWKPIEDVGMGDLVSTHTGTQRRVTGLWNKDVPSVPLYSVEYVSGEPLRLTGEHPVLIATKESTRCVYSSRPCKIDEHQSQCFHSASLPWKCAGGEKPCGRSKDDYRYDMKFVPISDVRKGDYLAKPIPSVVEDDDKFTPDICRLFGLYMGDGYPLWTWKNKERINPVAIEFCYGMGETNLHNETLRLIESICDSSVKVSTREVPERSGFYIKVWDSHLAKLFVEHGGHGAWTKRFSESVLHLPVEKQAIVVSGLFDTDGCYYEKLKQLSFSTSSEVLWNQVHVLLLRMGVENFPHRQTRLPSGFKKGIEPYDQLTITLSAGSSWKVDCKKNKSFGVSPDVSNQLCFFYDGYYLCPVKKVTHISFSGRVYNFSVEEDESYVVNNVAVHNCVANWITCSKCGKEINDSVKNCNCIDNQLLDYFMDENGVSRVISELCGRSYIDQVSGKRVGDPDSVKFIEASWVEKPAFKGAVLNHFVSDLSKQSSLIAKLPDRQLQAVVDDIFKLRVADTEGMMVLRVARDEIMRRRRLDLIDRVAHGACS